jgi:hypothetical protein
MTGDYRVVRIAFLHGGAVMKTFVSALFALSVLAGFAAPASALDTWQSPVRPTFTEQPE